MKTSGLRHGFTLVELLVVIGIIGILVAMLLPAVQSARESGRRVDCSNRLRQVTMASLTFSNVNGTLPAGTTSTPNGDVHHTWAAFVMPYLEIQTAYEQIDFSVPSWQPFVAAGLPVNPPDNPAQWAIMEYPVYQCPSQIPVAHTGVAAAFSHGNYVANNGFLYAIRQITDEQERKIENPTHLRGPFQQNFNTSEKGINLGHISDGLTNTAMFAETRLFPGEDGRGLLFLTPGSFYQHWFTPNSVGDDQNEFCSTTEVDFPCREDGIATRVGSLTSRSFHPGGVNVSFGDGRLEFVADSTDRRVWAAMGTRANNDALAGTLPSPLPPIFD